MTCRNYCNYEFMTRKERNYDWALNMDTSATVGRHNVIKKNTFNGFKLPYNCLELSDDVNRLSSLPSITSVCV